MILIMWKVIVLETKKNEMRNNLVFVFCYVFELVLFYSFYSEIRSSVLKLGVVLNYLEFG